MTNTAVAELFSGGKFSEVEHRLAENVEWNIYEEKMRLQGKADVVKFCGSIAEYFRSVTTKFETFGIVADTARVAIYGKAEFIREGVTVNTVNSCDVYEFDDKGNILKIHSYCNSDRPAENG
ncbi:nuclear transport factor 2-like protein [Mucilaginibacter pedocola]|nr:hypothetical protein [Mucilaginibacter pedocola]